MSSSGKGCLRFPCATRECDEDPLCAHVVQGALITDLWGAQAVPHLSWDAKESDRVMDQGPDRRSYKGAIGERRSKRRSSASIPKSSEMVCNERRGQKSDLLDIFHPCCVKYYVKYWSHQ